MAMEPAAKKMKVYDDVSKFQLIVEYIEKLQCSQKKLKAVLSEDLNNSIPMISVYAGCIKDPKNISKTIKILNEKIPLDGLNHLKRVRNNTILLCQPKLLNNMSIQEFIESCAPELKNVFDYFKEIPVPSESPKLRKQNIEVSKKWSCNFHPDVYLEKLASDSFFNVQEEAMHKTCMLMALEVAMHYFESNNIEVTDDIFKQVNATIVFDPNIKSVVAVALDNRVKHPVQHSVMIAIDNVAKTQDGGAWSTKHNSVNSNDLNQCVRLSGVESTLLKHLKRKISSITYGAKPFISKRDTDVPNKDANTGPYLCTNYYIYTLREPCLMCSMALVHARAKRVFFCFDNPEFGALKSKTKLHTVSSLNHRYEVFTNFL